MVTQDATGRACHCGTVWYCVSTPPVFFSGAPSQLPVGRVASLMSLE